MSRGVGRSPGGKREKPLLDVKGIEGKEEQMTKDLLSPAFSRFQFSSQVQNLGCYVVSGLVISAFLPAVAHGGNYFLSLSQVITHNVSLGSGDVDLVDSPAPYLLGHCPQGSSPGRPFLYVYGFFEKEERDYSTIRVWVGAAQYEVVGLSPSKESLKFNLPPGKLRSAESD